MILIVLALSRHDHPLKIIEYVERWKDEHLAREVSLLLLRLRRRSGELLSRIRAQYFVVIEQEVHETVIDDEDARTHVLVQVDLGIVGEEQVVHMLRGGLTVDCHL